MEPSITAKVEIAARILKEAGATAVYVFGSAGDEAEMLPGRSPQDIDLGVEGLPILEYPRVWSRLVDAVEMPVDLLNLDHPSSLATLLRKRGRLRRVA